MRPGVDVVWMKPCMSAVPKKARPKAWLSTPSNQCLQRLTTISTDREEKRDPRQDATKIMPYLLVA